MTSTSSSSNGLSMSGQVGKSGNLASVSGAPEYSVFSAQTWDEYLHRTPCVKSSYFVAVGCASIMAAHQLRLRKGAFLRAGFMASIAFGFAGYVNFSICAQERKRDYELFKRAFQVQNVKELGKDGKAPKDDGRTDTTTIGNDSSNP